jgi:hypothetical protein
MKNSVDAFLTTSYTAGVRIVVRATAPIVHMRSQTAQSARSIVMCTLYT